jgi:hypothetical protein
VSLDFEMAWSVWLRVRRLQILQGRLGEEKAIYENMLRDYEVLIGRKF